jgi:hypothetical protein
MAVEIELGDNLGLSSRSPAVRGLNLLRFTQRSTLRLSRGEI